jgi:hypothetical protein
VTLIKTQSQESLEQRTVGRGEAISYAYGSRPWMYLGVDLLLLSLLYNTFRVVVLKAVPIILNLYNFLTPSGVIKGSVCGPKESENEKLNICIAVRALRMFVALGAELVFNIDGGSPSARSNT